MFTHFIYEDEIIINGHGVVYNSYWFLNMLNQWLNLTVSFYKKVVFQSISNQMGLSLAFHLGHGTFDCLYRKYVLENDILFLIILNVINEKLNFERVLLRFVTFGINASI